MIELDRHTAPFFAPEFHGGEVEATFDYGGFGFEARVARDIGGRMRVVMQLQNDPQRGNFVLRSNRHWEALAQKGPSPELWQKIASLPDKTSHFSLERMHFYAPENQMITLDKYCYGKLISLEEPQSANIGFAFEHQAVPPLYNAREWEEYVAWDADGAFAMIEQFARNPQSELGQTLAYLKTDAEFKAQQAFGCSLANLERVRALLRAALVIAMAKGNLGEAQSWNFWMYNSSGLRQRGKLPAELIAWKTRICSALSCRELEMTSNQWYQTTAGNRITGPQRVINRWLATIAVKVSAPTAHEILEAQLQLRPFERVYPR